MSARRTVDAHTLGLFDTPQWTAAQTLHTLERLSDAGLLRRIDSALAAFIHQHDAGAEPALLMATAVLAQMEGRGHTCLPLAPLPQQPNDVLAWKSDLLPTQEALWALLPSTLQDWLKALQRSPCVRVVGRDADHGQPLVLRDADTAEPLLYLRRYWEYERQLAQHIAQRTASAPTVQDDAVVRHWLDRLFTSSGKRAPVLPAQPMPIDRAALDVDWQKLSCALALRGRLSVITGGPGTGKTYTAARLLAMLFVTAPDANQLRVALAAPTGKAAARLKESIDGSLLRLADTVAGTIDLPALVQRMGAARTLHSLLGARPDTRHFKHNAANPLDVDVLIVDEASMVHLEMMANVLDALPTHARLILLGDKDQLESVEAGAVLGDLCRNAEQGGYDADTLAYVERVTGQALPAVFHSTGAPLPLAQHIAMLRHSQRFEGEIGQLAQEVNSGRAAEAQARLQQQTARGLDAELWAREGGPVQHAVDMAVHGRGQWPGYAAYAQLLKTQPATGSSGDEAAYMAWVGSVLRAFEQFRLLCAVREGEWGVAGLNRAIAKALTQAQLLRAEGEWYVGRPVMITRNEPALNVFNGDIGITLPSFVDPSRRRVYFLRGHTVHHVSTARLVQVETAFALTVHKSQGSEFAHTMLVLPTHGGNVLGRELVYTGITRASQAFTLHAQAPGLLTTAIASPTRRSSGLLRFL